MKFALTLNFLFLLSYSYGQFVEETSTSLDERLVVCYAPNCSGAYYPSGMDSLRNYLSRSFHLTDEMLTKADNEKLIIKFTISPEGKVLNPFALCEIVECPECTEEAIRVILSMPDWIPSTFEGKPVSSYYHLPFTFKAQVPEKKN